MSSDSLPYQELIFFTAYQTLSLKNKWVDQDQRLLSTSYKYYTHPRATKIGERKKGEMMS